MRTFKPSIHRALKVLLVAVLVFSFLSLLGGIFDHFLGYTKVPVLGFLQLSFVEEFDLDNEANIPTYFSGLLLLFSSIILWVISYIERENNSSFYQHWFGLSLVFAFLSVDEVASLHERTTQPVRQLLGVEGIFYYAWTIPVAVGLLLLGVVYARFLWHLQARWKRLFAVAAVLYVGGALGVELISGWYDSQGGGASFTYTLITTVEETLEMAGAAVFIYALLDYLSDCVEGVAIKFQSAPDG